MTEDKALRFNEGKTRLDLIPAWAMEQVGKVFSFGATKHTIRDDAGAVIVDGCNNWRKGADWEVPLASLERHLNAFKRGEDYDKDSGLLHIAHLATNALFLLEFYKIHPQGDNRQHSYLKRPRIGLDLDGVLGNFSEAYSARLKEAGVANYPQQEQPWWGFAFKSNEIWEKVKQDESFWMGLKPLCDPNELAFEPVCYISNRSIPVEWSENWLISNGFPCAPVIHTEHSKVEAVKEWKLDKFCDDSVRNFVEINQSGGLCYLFDTSYNRYMEVGHKRIVNLNQLIQGTT
jgi:hypothetical protein